MTLNRTNIGLSIALVITVVITAATRVDYSASNVEILPDMKYTPAWAAYRANTVFGNGRTLQMPVTGTIARGQMPLHYEATKEDAVRAGNELPNPLHQANSDPTSLTDSLRRGSETYRVFCVSCHGTSGAGDGPVAKRGFPPPPSLLTGNSLQMKDGQLFHILTYGQGNMSDFAGQLSSQQRWDVINYVRSMQPKPKSLPGHASADEGNLTDDPDGTSSRGPVEQTVEE